MDRSKPARQDNPPAPFRGIYRQGKTVLIVLDVTDKQVEEILAIITKKETTPFIS